MYLLLLCINCSQIAGKDFTCLSCDFPVELIGKVAISILALSDSVNENIKFALSARITSTSCTAEILDSQPASCASNILDNNTTVFVHPSHQRTPSHV
jgi:hypothetical protein